ncbi:MAG: DUF4332 domain-containing protein, partial [Pirellulaceae bacterium]|nr:DUF4332 domain-containing protein [Pirellulaceae bacterium]
KTAKRLNAIGLSTVADLLAVVPTKAVQRLRRGYIDEQTITRWQAEATLVCCIPNLRGHDAQILVGCELRSPEEIAMFEPAELMELVEPFVSSSEGQRVLRSSSPPDEAEVESWINWASQARTLDAAA